MPCPVHNSDDNSDEGDSDAGGFRAEKSLIERREFMKSALVIGGSGALSSVANLYGLTESVAATATTPSYGDRGNRQHAWDAYEVYSESKGTSVPPSRHLLLHLSYAREGKPRHEDRRRAARAFDELEDLAGWGSDGLLFTVGYSADYFDRFDESLPDGLDPDGGPKPGLLRSRDLIDAGGVTLDKEDPTADTFDCVIHLASNDVTRLLAAEILLWGGKADIDGDGQDESLEHTLAGVFETPNPGTSGRPETFPYRRVGFAGHENLESEGGEEATDGVYPAAIPEDADLSMGFNDLFKNSVPREDNVTILEDQRLVEPKPPGVFAQGTIQHVSKLEMNLDPEEGWYQYDAEGRVDRMFSPDHDPDGMGEVGQDLGSSNTVTGDDAVATRDLDADDDIARRTEEHADEEGVVGHVAKTARARFDLEKRITDVGQERLSGGDRDELLPAEERPDDLRGHDGDQEAEQVILRRDFDTVDDDVPGLHFVALMRFNPYMVYMRRAMNGVSFDTSQFGLDPDGQGLKHEGSVSPHNDGIVGFTETIRRGNYLVPPLTQRALPHPRGEQVEITVQRAGENYRVAVKGITAGDLVDGSVRFGWYYDVNRARGAEPRQVTEQGNRTTFVFPADETGIDTAPGGRDGEDDVRVRLFAKRAGSRRPVRGTANLQDVGEGDGNSGEKGR